MLARRFLALSALILALCPAACGRRDDPSGYVAPSRPAGSAAAPAPQPAAAASAAAADEDRETKKRRMPEPMVFLDGKALAAIRFLELPPALKTRWIDPTNSGYLARRYSVADYVEALGVDLATVKQVHFIGGRNRHSIIDGPELIRNRDKLFFSFNQGERGKARMHYPSDGIKVNTQIDLVGTMAIYRDREPPKYHQTKLYAYFEEGKPIQGVPYAEDEREGGTRIYVDGKLVGAIKRKTLPSSVLVPGSAEAGESRFQLGPYLEQLGYPKASIQAVEMLSGDKVAATYDAKGYAEKIGGVVFTLPKRSRGRIQVMDLPESIAKLDAILLYQKNSLPDRAALAAHPGSPATQGSSSRPASPAKNRGVSDKSPVARTVQNGAPE